MSRVVNGDRIQIGATRLAEIFQVTVPVTDAQMKALPTTPLTLLAAPGSGKRIKVLGATLSVNQSGGAYTNVNVTYCALTIGNPADQWIGVLVNDSGVASPLSQVTKLLATDTTPRIVDFLLPASVAAQATTTPAQLYVVPGALTYPGDAASNWNNAVVQLRMDNNSSGNLTGGHASNAHAVLLYYVVETF